VVVAADCRGANDKFDFGLNFAATASAVQQFVLDCRRNISDNELSGRKRTVRLLLGLNGAAK